MGVLRFKHIFSRSFVGSSGVTQVVFIFLLTPCCLTQDFRAHPYFPNISFLWAWNAPTQSCPRKFNVSLDLRLFPLIGYPQKTAVGQPVTIFYVDRLGLYPHIDSHGNDENGGIPQLGTLDKHLQQAEKDIAHYIPTDKAGLAIIDWEEWRPIWARNWKPKDIYRNRSIVLVQQQNSQLSLAEATKVAKENFETAGRDFMLETLKLGKSLRPQHLWGYYLFPDCYNHQYSKRVYNGSCFIIEKRRNDELSWLWKESTALFPSIYLNIYLTSCARAMLFVRNRVLESIRVSKVRDVNNPLPIFIYTRPVFSDVSSQFLTREDLVSTIGETISLGASGMLIWGSLNFSQSRDTCTKLHDYLNTTLNPYIINVTLAAKMCNQVFCQNQGYCTRKNWNSSDYLHLNPMNFAIEIEADGKYKVRGKPTHKDLQQFADNFQCSCYANVSCAKKVNVLRDTHTIKRQMIQDSALQKTKGLKMVSLATRRPQPSGNTQARAWGGRWGGQPYGRRCSGRRCSQRLSDRHFTGLNIIVQEDWEKQFRGGAEVSSNKKWSEVLMSH